MKILVTGASGFIGSQLVTALLEQSYDVRATIRSGKHNLPSDNVELFECDLTNPSSLIGIEEGVGGVIHCAGLQGKWGRSEAQLRQVNVVGSLHLLERFCGKSVHRFIHLSAGGVTGPVAQAEVDETHPCAPVTPYEKTKYLAEKKMLERAREWDIPLTVVRPTFTYGPLDPHKLPLFRAVQKGRFVFIGHGQSAIHPVHIQDLLKGILLALEKGKVGETYIIGGERPAAKQEMIHVIADALEVRRPWIHVPESLAWAMACMLEAMGCLLKFEPILTRQRVLMMSKNFGYSIRKAHEELGYSPKISLQDGISKTIQYYRQNDMMQPLNKHQLSTYFKR